MSWDVLVVEDHADLREEVVTFLLRRGMTVRSAGNAAALDEALAIRSPDVVVLDLGLPGEDGVSVAARLSRGPRPALVIVTARSRVEDRILGLNAGADIYLTKPLDLRELEAAIAAVMRARQAAAPPLPLFAPGAEPAAEPAAPATAPHPWSLDLTRWQLAAPDGVVVALTETELAFLLALFEHPGVTVDRETVAARVDGDARGIDLVVHRLRRKVREATAEDLPVRTVRARGYVFTDTVTIR